MKKILAILLTLAMATVVVSCGEKKEAESEAPNVVEKLTENAEVAPVQKYNNEQDKAAARASVDGYMTAYCSFDAAEMSKYTNTDLSKKLGIDNYSDFIGEKIRSYFTEEEATAFADEIAQLDSVCKKAILESASYEILDAKYNDEKWSFDVNAKIITVSDIFSVLHGDKATELTEELLNELVAKLSDPNVTDEEAMKIAQDMLNASLTAIVNFVTEACETTEPTSTDYVVTAVKSGDKWIVDYNEGDAESIATSLLDNKENA